MFAAIAIFFCGVLVCFLVISFIVGISYNLAFILGRGVGMCAGVLMASNIFYKNRNGKNKYQIAIDVEREFDKDHEKYAARAVKYCPSNFEKWCQGKMNKQEKG